MEFVFVGEGGTAGVGADAGLGEVQGHVRRVAGEQVGSVLRVLQVGCGPVADREAEQVGSRFDPERADGRPAGVDAVTVLLGTHVRRLQLVDRRGVLTDRSRPPGVDVRLTRPCTEPLDLLNPRQLEGDRQSRQGRRELAVRLHGEVQPDRAVLCVTPAPGSNQAPLQRGRRSTGDYLPRAVLQAGRHQAVLHPVESCFPPSVRDPGDRVVVGLCAPHVQPGVPQPQRSYCDPVDASGDVLARGLGTSMPCLTSRVTVSSRVARVPRRGGLVETDLTPGNPVTGLCPCGVFGQLGSNRQPGLGLGGCLSRQLYRGGPAGSDHGHRQSP